MFPLDLNNSVNELGISGLYALSLCILSTLLHFLLAFIYLFFLFFNFTILCWFCHISTWIRHRYTHVPILNPPPSPYHPSESSQCTSRKHPVSFIEPGLATRFLYDIIYISMPFSQIIPPSPSQKEKHQYMEFRKMVTITLYMRQQKRHWCIEQPSGI